MERHPPWAFTRRGYRVSAQGFNPAELHNKRFRPNEGARAYQVERSGEHEHDNENDKKSGEDPYTDTQRLRVVTV